MVGQADDVTDCLGRLIVVLENGAVECMELTCGEVQWMINCGGSLCSFSSNVGLTTPTRPLSLTSSSCTSPTAPDTPALPPPKAATSELKRREPSQSGVSAALRKTFAGLSESDNDESASDAGSVGAPSKAATPGSKARRREPLPAALEQPHQQQQQQRDMRLSTPVTPKSVVPYFIPGFGSAHDHVYIYNGAELRRSDELFTDSVLIASQAVVLNSSENVYMEVRLSDGAVLCDSIDKPRVTPPLPVAASHADPHAGMGFRKPFGSDVVLALVRHNKISKGRHQGVTWELRKGNVVVSDVSTPPPQASTASSGARAICGCDDAAAAMPHIRAFVNGRVELVDADGDSIWEKELDSPLIKAYFFSPAVSGGAKLLEVPVEVDQVGCTTPGDVAIYFEPGRFLFTTGEPPERISVARFNQSTKAQRISSAAYEDPLMIEWTKRGGAAAAKGGAAEASRRPIIQSVPSTPHDPRAASAWTTFVVAAEGPERDNGSFGRSRVESVTDDTLSVASAATRTENLRSGPGGNGVATSSPSFLLEFFDPIRVLGRGGCGKVILARHRMTGKLYAIKMLVVRNAVEEDEVLNEVSVHEPLVHRNIVRYFHFWVESMSPHLRRLLATDSWQRREDEAVDTANNGPQGCGSLFEGGDDVEEDQETTADDDDDDGTSTTTSSTATAPTERVALIQMEFCPSTLATWMEGRRRVSREDNIRVALQIVAAVMTMHDNDVVHRDISPRNLFLDASTLIVKLGDMGLAKVRSSGGGDGGAQVVGFFDSATEHTLGVGSPMYASPEQLAGRECSPAVDIFAAGVVIAELYTMPTTAAERHANLNAIRSGTFFTAPANIAAYPELGSVIAHMVRHNPRERMPLFQVRKLLKAISDKLVGDGGA